MPRGNCNTGEKGLNPPLSANFWAAVTGRCTTMYWKVGTDLGDSKAYPHILWGLANTVVVDMISSGLQPFRIVPQHAFVGTITTVEAPTCFLFQPAFW